MRVVDLDRDMRDVIPTGTSRDSEFLFQRMTDLTLDATEPGPGRRILDVASGLGQDAGALVGRGGWVVGAEPSGRMTDLARMTAGESDGPTPVWVRSWSDALPFADGSFDAVFCKGAIDHFDQPRRAIAEMARVTRDEGRVVLAVANVESAACRVSRTLDAARERWFGDRLPRGRRHYDVPHDHFTRYELDLMREQASEFLELESVEGCSMAWGLPGWSRTVQRLPGVLADAALQGLDLLARLAPQLADVVVLAGRPRRSAMAST
jgi:SAM-dependent methyltransferase